MLTKYSVTLNIDIETYHAIPGLLNEFVKPGIPIKGIKWDKIMKYENDEMLDVTDEELDEINYKNKEITITSNGVTQTFKNINGFSDRELLKCILDIEVKARPNTDWFGGIDAHHIYFEGLHGENGNYKVSWGS